MKQLRTVIFWCHLVAGVTAGIVIMTGVLLAYERQIERCADTRDYAVARPLPDAARLPVETLLARVREPQPAATSSTAITLHDDAASSGTTCIS